MWIATDRRLWGLGFCKIAEFYPWYLMYSIVINYIGFEGDSSSFATYLCQFLHSLAVWLLGCVHDCLVWLVCICTYPFCIVCYLPLVHAEFFFKNLIKYLTQTHVAGKTKTLKYRKDCIIIWGSFEQGTTNVSYDGNWV